MRINSPSGSVVSSQHFDKASGNGAGSLTSCHLLPTARKLLLHLSAVSPSPPPPPQIRGISGDLHQHLGVWRVSFIAFIQQMSSKSTQAPGMYYE